MTYNPPYVGNPWLPGLYRDPLLFFALARLPVVLVLLGVIGLIYGLWRALK